MRSMVLLSSSPLPPSFYLGDKSKHTPPNKGFLCSSSLGLVIAPARGPRICYSKKQIFSLSPDLKKIFRAADSPFELKLHGKLLWPTVARYLTQHASLQLWDQLGLHHGQDPRRNMFLLSSAIVECISAGISVKLNNVNTHAQFYVRNELHMVTRKSCCSWQNYSTTSL